MRDRLRVIYTPSGRAGEYANHGYALNLYTTCPHECVYCYNVCGNRYQTAERYFCEPKPRKDVIKLLKRDLADIGVVAEPIFLSFVGDPLPYGYPNDLFWEAEEAIHTSGNHLCVLTKNPNSLLVHVDRFKAGDQLGTTLVFRGDADCLRWEPGAPVSRDRIDAMRDIKRLAAPGVKLWISCEPTVIPHATLVMANECAEFVDVIKFGKLNHEKRLPEDLRQQKPEVNWASFACDVIALMEQPGMCDYVLKEDLRRELEVAS